MIYETAIKRETNLLLKSSTLEVYRAEEQQDAGVLWFMSPQLHAVLLGTLIVAGLVFTVGKLGKPCQTQHSTIYIIVSK